MNDERSLQTIQVKRYASIYGVCMFGKSEGNLQGCTKAVYQYLLLISLFGLCEDIVCRFFFQ